MEIKHLEVQLHVVKHGDNPGDNADGRSNQKWIIQKTFLGNLRDVWKPAESLVFVQNGAQNASETNQSADRVADVVNAIALEVLLDLIQIIKDFHKDDCVRAETVMTFQE